MSDYSYYLDMINKAGYEAITISDMDKSDNEPCYFVVIQNKTNQYVYSAIFHEYGKLKKIFLGDEICECPYDN